MKIISYSDQHQVSFKNLNHEWLEQFNLLEPHDLEILDHPREMVINTGGFIYLAESNDEIIGTAALIKLSDTVFELVKMSVAPAWRGKGLSKLLIEACLEKARELKAKKIVLFSNHRLVAALKLYEKYSFQYVPVEDSPFETADIKMELSL
jgi:N-acetylglutamate synthase-like GNAT family acetyltransferase